MNKSAERPVKISSIFNQQFDKTEAVFSPSSANSKLTKNYESIAFYQEFQKNVSKTPKTNGFDLQKSSEYQEKKPMIMDQQDLEGDEKYQITNSNQQQVRQSLMTNKQLPSSKLINVKKLENQYHFQLKSISQANNILNNKVGNQSFAQDKLRNEVNNQGFLMKQQAFESSNDQYDRQIKQKKNQVKIQNGHEGYIDQMEKNKKERFDEYADYQQRGKLFVKENDHLNFIQNGSQNFHMNKSQIINDNELRIDDQKEGIKQYYLNPIQYNTVNKRQLNNSAIKIAKHQIGYTSQNKDLEANKIEQKQEKNAQTIDKSFIKQQMIFNINKSKQENLSHSLVQKNFGERGRSIDHSSQCQSARDDQQKHENQNKLRPNEIENEKLLYTSINKINSLTKRKSSACNQVRKYREKSEQQFQKMNNLDYRKDNDPHSSSIDERNYQNNQDMPNFTKNKNTTYPQNIFQYANLANLCKNQKASDNIHQKLLRYNSRNQRQKDYNTTSQQRILGEEYQINAERSKLQQLEQINSQINQDLQLKLPNSIKKDQIVQNKKIQNYKVQKLDAISNFQTDKNGIAGQLQSLLVNEGQQTIIKRDQQKNSDVFQNVRKLNQQVFIQNSNEIKQEQLRNLDQNKKMEENKNNKQIKDEIQRQSKLQKNGTKRNLDILQIASGLISEKNESQHSSRQLLILNGQKGLINSFNQDKSKKKLNSKRKESEILQLEREKNVSAIQKQDDRYKDKSIIFPADPNYKQSAQDNPLFTNSKMTTDIIDAYQIQENSIDYNKEKNEKDVNSFKTKNSIGVEGNILTSQDKQLNLLGLNGQNSIFNTQKNNKKKLLLNVSNGGNHESLQSQISPTESQLSNYAKQNTQGVSPYKAETIDNSANRNSQMFSNRQIFVNKVSKNIHIMPDEKKNPYDGLFQIGGKKLEPQNLTNKNNIKEQSGIPGIELQKYSSPNVGMKNYLENQSFNNNIARDPNKLVKINSPYQNQYKMTQGLNFQDQIYIKKNIFDDLSGNKPNIYPNKMQNNNYLEQQKRILNQNQIQNSQKNNGKVFSPQQQTQQPKKQVNPDEFDIEYAQLIARQFPIQDEKGNVIDYSNINEYQLELLALHEEYGEEVDPVSRKQIFYKLTAMNESEFYIKRKRNGFNKKGGDQNDSSTSASTAATDPNSRGLKNKNQFVHKPYGNNVGKDGGNPEYKKTVIQLEKERLEKEKQELIMKRKRNSQYIQQCIKNGNEYYDQNKLNSLIWLRKDNQNNKDDDQNLHHQNILSRIDDKNMEILRRKQEIIAKYNKMSKENKPMIADDGMYRYLILKGNNSNLVKRVLETREYWVELEQQHLTLFSFKWAPVSKLINYEQLGLHGSKKLVNHLERHDLLTTKDQLYSNMHRYCEQNKLNVFQYLPIQFILDLSSKNFINEVDRFCQYFNIIEKVRLNIPEDSSKIKGHVHSNQIENAENADIQIQTINQIISKNRSVQQEIKYKNLISRKFTMEPQMYNGKNVWLIKPNDFNRGRGVKLFNSLEQLRKLMKEYSQGNEMDFYVHNACCQILTNEKQLGNHVAFMAKNDESFQNKIITENTEPMVVNEKDNEQSNAPNLGANVKSEVFVIQKYIERPLLIDQRKFDIRLWVLINCCDLKQQKCYLFSEGYIRMSSHKFTLSQQSIDKPFVHLTNNAVQQFDKNYGKLEEGNQLSFKQGSQIIKEQTGQDIDFYTLLNEDILNIILMTMKCVDQGRLNPQNKKYQFEIFGYDFMIDESMKPWLIEVNTNPCIEETSQLLKMLLPRMIDDAFKLTLDYLYPPPKNFIGASSAQKVYNVDGYDDNVNMWKHIYNLKSIQ